MTEVQQHAAYLLQCAGFAFAGGHISKQDFVQCILAEEAVNKALLEAEKLKTELQAVTPDD